MWCGGASSFEKATHNHPGLPKTLALQRAFLGIKGGYVLKDKEVIKMKRRASVRMSLSTLNMQSLRRNSVEVGTQLLEVPNESGSFHSRGSIIRNSIIESIKLKAEEEERVAKALRLGKSHGIIQPNQKRSQIPSDSDDSDSDTSSAKLKRKPKKQVNKHFRLSTYYSGMSKNNIFKEIKAVDTHRKSYQIKSSRETPTTKDSELTLPVVKLNKSPSQTAIKGSLTTAKSVRKVYGLSREVSKDKLLPPPSPNYTNTSSKKTELPMMSPRGLKASLPLALRNIVTAGSNEKTVKRSQQKSDTKNKLLSWTPNILENMALSPAEKDSKKFGFNTISPREKTIKAIESPRIKIKGQTEFLLKIYSPRVAKEVP